MKLSLNESIDLVAELSQNEGVSHYGKACTNVLAALAEAQREIARLNERIDDLLNCSSFACPYEKRMQTAESALAAVTRERETAQESVQEWRGKVAALREYHEVSEKFTMGSEGTYWLGFRDAHTASLAKLDSLGLTSPEPLREKA